MAPRRSSASASSSSKEGRLSDVESKLYQAALASPNQIATQEELDTRFRDIPVDERMVAINSLLRKNLFTAQKVGDGLQFVATAKTEASMMGKLDENENIVYSHIKDARNEGIWTKQLKARTGLHQTIINRCLKSLEQKQLVKAVKSVKYPTRKIYMLFNLQPSTELSGGPWYTDNELDTGFINELSMACLNFIRSKSFPKNGQSRALYPASHAHHLPSAQSIHYYLRNSGLTETELEVDHVVSLLDILVYDEQIEKIPVISFSGFTNGDADSDYEDEEKIGSSSGGSGSSSNESEDDSDESESASETGSESGKKRKRSSKAKSRARKKSKTKSRSRSKSRGRTPDSEDEAPTSIRAGTEPFVYRATRPLSVRVGWTETPCGHCPVFDFCDESGPVNAESCQYYGGVEDQVGRKLADGWVDAAVAEEEEKDEEDEGEAEQKEDAE